MCCYVSLYEFVSFWTEQHKNLSSEQITETAKIVLDFTGGYFFPFLTVSNYFFQSFAEKNWNSPSIKRFLQSQEFFQGEVYKTIVQRCFQAIIDPYLELCTKLLLGQVEASTIGPLEAMGLWDSEKMSFCSPLLKQYLFHRCVKEFKNSQVKPQETILLANDVGWLEGVAQVIENGLAYMHPHNFEMPKGSPVEDALGFHWGFQRIENLYMSPQTPADKEMVRERYFTKVLKKEKFKLVPSKPGRPPTVDWFLNSRLGVALECIRDGDERGIEEKFRKFQEEYKEWPNNALLNFQMAGKMLNYDVKNKPYADRLFTFVKESNSLYRGSELCRPNVVHRLATMPIARFSTLGRMLLR